MSDEGLYSASFGEGKGVWHWLDALPVEEQISIMEIPGFPRIGVDPAICGGRPVIAGTRVRVADILDMLAAGESETTIVADFPYLTAADIRAALAYAASGSGHPVVIAAE